ncbi:hypothetical protein ACIPWE_40285 [Streptomyces sp. NPDC090073]|uniref:hypothetical protein n=1 Tax=Streptomyces sp. NPDC090073 TaxID=3365936 RepID=UPI0038145D77
MPLLDWDPGQSPEAPGTLFFYEQGQDPSTGFQVTSRGQILSSVAAAYTGATAGTPVFTSKVTGDTQQRFEIDADGTLKWGSGSGAADVTVDRYAAGGLEISGALRFTNGQLLFRSDGSVNLFSNAVDTLHTDNALDVAKNVSSAGTFANTGATAAALALTGIVTGDTFDRFRIQDDGKMLFGPGNATRDTTLYRSASATLATDGSLSLATAGGRLLVKEGTNAGMGLATLVAGTVTVNTTAVTANTRVFLTAQSTGGTAGAVRVSARVAGTSFTITSTSGTDTSTVAWLLVEPAP